ncbi:putative cytochrome p450 protein [Neofusicoccum parvum UCRNP2]|uniref:Putative cytochrome p450 protein n=1 Tax=Botryosphaeria parva (strain UCR-NP2) TaxID=1287680 RepID=R1EGJ8_BOTPV|nr:putative cytochrome p450 protein [Neofusicoccum parvum UCRNP2]
MAKSLRVGVIGPAGFTGSYLCVELIKRGHHVIGMSRSPEKIGAHEKYTPRKVDVDAQSIDELAAAFKDVDVLVNAYGPHTAGAGALKYMPFLEVTRKMVLATRLAKVPYFMQVGGTGSLYVPGRQSFQCAAETTDFWLAFRRAIADSEAHTVYMEERLGPIGARLRGYRNARLAARAGKETEETKAVIKQVEDHIRSGDQSKEFVTGARTSFMFFDGNTAFRWTYVSPSAMYRSGKRTGKYETGTDYLPLKGDPMDGKELDGRLHGISAGDLAIAIADEAEAQQRLSPAIEQPDPELPTMALVTLLIFPVVAVLLFRLLSRRQTPTPKGLRTVPGPGGKLPIIGHAHLLKPTGSQRQFIEWAHQYGELFSFQLGWENWIFVNSPAAVKEIFDKQSAATSGRAPMPVGSDLISGDMRFLLMTYSPRWRRLRAIVHKLLTPKASDTFKPSQEFEAKQLLHDILKEPHNTYDHCRRYTTSVVMTSTYGRRIPEFDTREVYGLMKDFTDNMPPTNAFLPDLIPPLAKLPTWMQWWRKPALRMQMRQTAIWTKYWRTLLKQIEEKKAPECFVKQFIETDYQKQDITEMQAAWVAGTMIEAGSETTSSTLNTTIKYLAAYPEVQERANSELTSVVGDARSPAFEDEAALPYIRAIAKEVLRMRPITNFGTPHYTTEPVRYKDFWIPANTVVTINQYAIHHDAARYKDPEVFRPERYLGHPHKSGVYAAAADPYERDHFSFGAGRRICSGMHLAENSLFITLAKILWAYEIAPLIGPDGKPEQVDLSDDGFEPGVNTLPKPYRVGFKPRSAEREAVVRSEWDTALKEGFWLGDRQVNADGMVVG